MALELRDFFPGCLRDERLAPHAVASAPAWLWSEDGARLIWANPTAAAIFDAPHPAAAIALKFEPGHPAAMQVARIAPTLPPDAAPRLERLRGFGAKFGLALTCACSRITLADKSHAVLVVAMESAGPALTLAERVRRLLAECARAIAAFSADGRLMHATPAALDLIGEASTLAGLGIDADGDGASARFPGLHIDRLGSGSSAVVFATFVETAEEAAPALPQQATQEATEAEPEPAKPHQIQRAGAPSALRHPFRFVWHTDAEERFTIGSDQFIAVVGPRTAEASGRPWREFAAALGLDPEGALAQALAARDTFSNVPVAWPVDDAEESLAVELSGLPMFDRERKFTGYRGYAVCRDAPRIAALIEARRAAAEAGAREAASPANVVPFPAADPAAEPPVLSANEHSAFRELTRQLTERLNNPPAPASFAPARGEGERSPAARDSAAAERLKAAELAFHSMETEARELRSILDTATDGVVVLERQGRVVSCNRSAEALFGWESGELAGHSFLDLFAPESQRVAADYLDGLQRAGVASLLNDGREVIGRVRQGGLIPLFMTMGRIADETQKFCAVFRDITQWKKAEEELLNAKRMAERASSAKSEFLAKVSHEIRTPLNAVIGFSEVMISERFGPIGNERYREYLKDIRASGSHLLSLINDLLDLSKIEAGRLDLNFTSVNLNELTQQCVALMQPQANRERIIIRTSIAPALPRIVADARSVRQIVLNLLSNSIKFTGPGGQVIVSTALSDAGEVVLRVRDTGVGMSEKDIAMALEPFRQLQTSAPLAGGTGLGLPLTKALAEANRASFSIRSAPNAGTLVEISFPATRVLAE